MNKADINGDINCESCLCTEPIDKLHLKNENYCWKMFWSLLEFLHRLKIRPN